MTAESGVGLGQRKVQMPIPSSGHTAAMCYEYPHARRLVESPSKGGDSDEEGEDMILEDLRAYHNWIHQA